MAIVGTEAGHGCHCDAVGELDAADAEGGEEFCHFCSWSWYWLIFDI